MTVEIEPVLTTRLLLQTAARNYRVILRQVAGLSHGDSLLQLPFRGNCLNWVVGHITRSRNEMLELVGVEAVWTDEQNLRYGTGSEPITNDEDALSFEQMLADLKTAHERLTVKLMQMTNDDLNAAASSDDPNTPPPSVGDMLDGLLWHETYHVGQTEILRQLAGTNDKVI